VVLVLSWPSQSAMTLKDTPDCSRCIATVWRQCRWRHWRHSAATALLAEGASLESIAVLLRHRSLDTTAHYAKVDVKLLRELAHPWPEVSPC
jgi:integrase